MPLYRVTGAASYTTFVEADNENDAILKAEFDFIEWAREIGFEITDTQIIEPTDPDYLDWKGEE